MAEPATTTTTPAPAAGMTAEQIAAINTAVNTALTTALKPVTDAIGVISRDQGILADTLKQLPPAGLGDGKSKVEPPKDDANKPLTAADLQKLLDDRDSKRQQQQDLTDQRKQFVKEKLPKLPPVYADQLGDDPKAWDAKAAELRTQYENDLKANGFKPVDVAGATAGGQPAAALPTDISKMSPQQQKDAALKALPPVGSPAPATQAPQQQAAVGQAATA